MKSNRKINSNIKWLIPLCILVISGATLYFVVHKAGMAGYEQVRTKAELNAVTYADRMSANLNEGVNITNSLKQILISENGEIDKFDSVAESMMTDYVQSIQLAPGGVVNEIYPAEGNEAGKIDLIHDEKRGEIVNYGINNHMIVMQGPFELKQGGNGIAIRNPVYLTGDDGEEYFWGLTIVIIRVPEIFHDSVRSLSNFGYAYRLYKTVSPLNSDVKMIDGSDEEMTNPVSYYFELGGCTWRLDVMPADGWINKYNTYTIAVCGIIMIILLEGLTIALLVMEEQRKHFRRLAITDGLTGLLNRNGFNNELDSYLRENGDKVCVGIMLDVDDFKSINDVYGHAVGDEALKHLASSMQSAFPDKSIIGRNGGDEFCVILKGITAVDAQAQIEKFCNMRHTFSFKGVQYNYSISMGYAEYPWHAKKGSELLRYADMALYEVKLKGKNGCMCYSDKLPQSGRTQLGFRVNDITHNMPGAFFVYKADREDEQILYANQEMIRLTGCDNLDDFLDFTGRKFGNLVHPDELSKVEKSIWDQIEASEDNTNDYVQYHLATKDGTYRKVLDFGHIVDSEQYGQVFYVLLVDYAKVPLS